MSSADPFRVQLAEVLADFIDAKQDSPGFVDAAITITLGRSSDIIRDRVDDIDPTLAPALAAALAAVPPTTQYAVNSVPFAGGPPVYMCSMVVDPDYTADYVVIAHMVLNRPPLSRLPPRYLRQFAQTLEAALAEVSEVPDLDDVEFAYLAARARVMPLTMSYVSACCRAQGSMLWLYDYDDETYRSIHAHGLVGEDFKVRLEGVTREDGTVLGVVGQAGPSVPLVVYSRSDPERRIPTHIEHWEPHDPGVMDANQWDACVAWPVLADGYVLGALTIYGSSLRRIRYDRRTRNTCAMLVAEVLRDVGLRNELRNSEASFEEELSKAAHGRLAGELVHDYKSTLETIENLLKNLQPERLRQPLRILYTETLTSIAYLKDVTRTLSKLSRGQRTGGSTDLAETVLGGEAFLRALVKTENPKASLTVHAPKQVPKGETCHVDMDDLTALRIAGNLVHNAAIWTRSEDHPEITVTVRAAESRRSTRPAALVGDSDIVRLTVADNGPGVGQASAQRIFSRGWTNRRAAGGSGLGLYIVRKAVESAGGTIAEVGRPGEGAVFDVRLPAHGSRDRRVVV